MFATSVCRPPATVASFDFPDSDQNEAIAHPAEPALNPNEAFARTAERATLAKAVGVPARQICTSPKAVALSNHPADSG